MENTEVELLGVERGNATTLTREHNASELDIHPVSCGQDSKLLVMHLAWCRNCWRKVVALTWISETDSGCFLAVGVKALPLCRVQRKAGGAKLGGHFCSGSHLSDTV